MKNIFINSSYLGLASICLLGYIFDPIVILIKEKYLGCSADEWSPNNLASYWWIMASIWFSLSILTIFLAHNFYNLNVIEHKEALNSRNALYAISVAIFTLLVIFFIKKQFGFIYAVRNWQSIYIAQYVYYLAEILVAICFVCFAQNSCVQDFLMSNKIPWGGVFLGLTWGLMHWWTQQSLTIGVTGMALGLIFGLLYVLFDYNFFLTYITCFALFICL